MNASNPHLSRAFSHFCYGAGAGEEVAVIVPVQRNVQHIRVLLEAQLRSVAVVNVLKGINQYQGMSTRIITRQPINSDTHPIDNGNSPALLRIAREQVFCRHRDVVEEAEAHRLK